MTLAEIVAALDELTVEIRALRVDIDHSATLARQRYRTRFQQLVFVVNCDFSADGNRPGMSVFGDRDGDISSL